MFSAIAILYQSLDSQRTDLAHGIFAVSEDYLTRFCGSIPSIIRSITSKAGPMFQATAYWGNSLKTRNPKTSCAASFSSITRMTSFHCVTK